MNETRVAEYWEKTADKTIKCGLCPHYCTINTNQTGKCGVRTNKEGTLYASSYGKITSIALDPIEKKPLYMFHPGKKIASIGSYGCNFHCQFCQNHNISIEYGKIRPDLMTPELVRDVALLAVQDNNIGIAYTYNEPLVGYEFVKDCSSLIHEAGLLNVLVTNGYINKEPLEKLLPSIDALNIDIKGNNKGTYNMVGGTLDTVKETIELSNEVCHVEVTTLVLPNENENAVEEISKWLSSINPEIPYHLSRSFPRYKYSGREPTPPETMYRLFDTAKKHLKNVFIGNM